MEANWLRDFAERYTAAWCSQTPASVASFFSSNGSLKVNDGSPAVGRISISEVAQSFMTAFPDLTILLDEAVIEGEGAIYRWTLVGTNNGPGGTGNSVRISGFEQWTFGVDGLIAESLGHFDTADYEQQLLGGDQADRHAASR